MTAILLLFFDICRLKRNPQDIPSSKLLKTLSILYFFGSCLLYKGLAAPTITLAAFMTVLETVLLLALGYAALWTRGFEKRATQTITALAGTGATLYMITIPMLILPNDLATLFSVVIFVWSIVVIGHILRHALDIAFGWGFAISFLFFIFQNNLFAVLFIPNQ